MLDREPYHIPTLEKVVGTSALEGLQIIEPDDEQWRKLMHGIAIVQRWEKLDDVKFQLFDKPQHRDIVGHADMINNTISIATAILDDPVQLVATIVHELDHLRTGHGDTDREFRNVADIRIAKLMLDYMKGEEQ
jgi:hypothetical protein